MQRTLALGALWTASAGAAVGLGFLAVSLVDASASPGTGPVAASITTSGTPATPTPTPTSATGEFATVAGTVYANCTGGVPVLAGAPAAGWWIDDSNDGGEFEFESATQKLEVHVVCAGGGPQFSVEGPRADDNGGRGGDDDSPSPSSSSPASSPSADNTSGSDDDGDDSSGRDGGGHGSDDSGSDDSGSGSDDSGSGSGNSGSGDSGGDD